MAASPSLVTGFRLGLSFFRKGRTSETGLSHSFRVISGLPYLPDKINIYQIRLGDKSRAGTAYLTVRGNPTTTVLYSRSSIVADL